MCSVGDAAAAPVAVTTTTTTAQDIPLHASAALSESKNAEMAQSDGKSVSGTAGLPSEKPTKSYWLKDLSPLLEGHRTTAELPAEADVVIVGSGVTGAFAAWFLKMGVDLDLGAENGQASEQDGHDLEGGLNGEEKFDQEERSQNNRRVVMLEAREVCSGATGRNGGHCQPLVYFHPSSAEFELENYHFLESFVRKHNIPCDWVKQSGVQAYLSQDIFELAQDAVEQLKETHPHLAAQVTIVKPGNSNDNNHTTYGEIQGRNESDKKKPATTTTLSSLRIPHTKGAIIQQHAASLWPYKLVSWLLEYLLSKYPPEEFNIQTNTPVISLRRYIFQSKSGSSVGDEGRCKKWLLHTPRGDIIANKVILATNGYTSHLLPKLSDLIVPVRGQMAALLPPSPPPSCGNPSRERDAEQTIVADKVSKESITKLNNNASNTKGNNDTAVKKDQEVAQLEHAYVFLASGEGGDDEGYNTKDDHVIQRPVRSMSSEGMRVGEGSGSKGGELIFGGGRDFASPNNGVGVWEDDTIDEDVSKYLRSHLSPPLNLHPGSPVFQLDDVASASGVCGREDINGESLLRATHEWTGIMGFTADQNPLVGPVPTSLLPGTESDIYGTRDGYEAERTSPIQPEQDQETGRTRGEGVWVCAGYNGHGMPVAALSARAVVEQVLGLSESSSASPSRGNDNRKARLPQEFELTEERVEILQPGYPRGGPAWSECGATWQEVDI